MRRCLGQIASRSARPPCGNRARAAPSAPLRPHLVLEWPPEKIARGAHPARACRASSRLDLLQRQRGPSPRPSRLIPAAEKRPHPRSGVAHELRRRDSPSPEKRSAQPGTREGRPRHAADGHHRGLLACTQLQGRSGRRRRRALTPANERPGTRCPSRREGPAAARRSAGTQDGTARRRPQRERWRVHGPCRHDRERLHAARAAGSHRESRQAGVALAHRLLLAAAQRHDRRRQQKSAATREGRRRRHTLCGVH